MKELEFIQRIREAAPAGGRVRLGVGDDAAVVEAARGVVVVTTDAIVEGIHFRRSDPPRLVGRKSISVSLSDVAAMGCRATAAFLAVALPRDRVDELAPELLAGALDAVRPFSVPLAGGDTTESPGPVVLVSTVLGEPFPGRDVVRRSGARPGDALFVTGELGGSLAGRHLEFTPRLAAAEALLRDFSPHAMIDLSDGLASDARRIAEESGVRIVIEAAAIPISPAARGAAADAAEALRHAFSDGEDFDLLFAAPADQAEALSAGGLAGVPVTRIGRIEAGPATVVLARPDGGEEELLARGYEHFR